MSFSFLKGHKDSITCLAKHQTYLVSGSEDKSVRLWDRRVNRAAKCIVGDFYDEIACLSDFPRNENLLCVGCDTSVFCYDLRNTSVILKSCDQCITVNADCVNKIHPFVLNNVGYLGICDDHGDLVMWNCDQQEEPTVLEGIHDGICGDFFIRNENENLLFVSGGYDQAIAITNTDGEILDKWSISPLNTALPSVNPPFVVCLTECESNHRIYCGCGDGSIRYLYKNQNDHIVTPVITCHASSISDIQSIERDNHHYICSTGNDLLFTIHEETNKDIYLFNEKIRLDMKWKTNSFIIIDDTIYFGGLSNQILCADGLFRFYCYLLLENKSI